MSKYEIPCAGVDELTFDEPNVTVYYGNTFTGLHISLSKEPTINEPLKESPEAGVIDQLALCEKIPSVESETEAVEEALVDATATHIDEEILPDIIQASNLRDEFSPFDEDTDLFMSLNRIVEGLDHSEDGDESDKDQCDQQQSITNSTKSKIVFNGFDNRQKERNIEIRKKSTVDVQLQNDEFQEIFTSNLRPLQQNVQQERSTEKISSENVISLPAKEVLVLPDLEEDEVSDKTHTLTSTKVTSSNEILTAEQLDGDIKNIIDNDATKLEADSQVILPRKSNKRPTSDTEQVTIIQRKSRKIGTSTVSEPDLYDRQSSHKVKAIRNAISSEQKSVADRVTKREKCEQGVVKKKLKAHQQVGGLFSRLREKCKNLTPNFLRKMVFPDK